jgi:hypothetical protein
MRETPARRRLRAAGVLAASLLAALSLVRCGADHLDAPARPDLDAPGSQCRSLEVYMPAFFELLRAPEDPLRPLRLLVADLSGATRAREVDPIAALLQTVFSSLRQFARDPFETALGCWPVTPESPLPDWPMCGRHLSRDVECESRLCAFGRALDFLVRDRAANDAIEALRPVLVTLLGYVSNTQPGGDGREHYEVIEVFNRTSTNEALCSPRNLIVLLDGIVTYFRPNAACSRDRSCVGLEALDVIVDLVRDPALDQFLTRFEADQESGRGRAAIQVLGRVVFDALANLSEDRTFFDPVETLLRQLLYPFLDRDPETYGGLREKLDRGVVVLKGLLDPEREGAILRELKAVVHCLNQSDPDGLVVGTLYDLLSRPSGQGGLDLEELVASFSDLVELDRSGVLLGALHAILSTARDDDKAMETVRVLLARVLTVENSRRVVPVLKTMLDRGVLDELIVAADNIIFGCRGEPE